jgi:hypothetical protein
MLRPRPSIAWAFKILYVSLSGLDVTNYDLYDFGRVTTSVSFTPEEARKIAVELMTAAALAEERN